MQQYERRYIAEACKKLHQQCQVTDEFARGRDTPLSLSFLCRTRHADSSRERESRESDTNRHVRHSLTESTALFLPLVSSFRIPFLLFSPLSLKYLKSYQARGESVIGGELFIYCKGKSRRRTDHACALYPACLVPRPL